MSRLARFLVFAALSLLLESAGARPWVQLGPEHNFHASVDGLNIISTTVRAGGDRPGYGPLGRGLQAAETAQVEQVAVIAGIAAAVPPIEKASTDPPHGTFLLPGQSMLQKCRGVTVSLARPTCQLGVVA